MIPGSDSEVSRGGHEPGAPVVNEDWNRSWKVPSLMKSKADSDRSSGHHRWCFYLFMPTEGSGTLAGIIMEVVGTWYSENCHPRGHVPLP